MTYIWLSVGFTYDLFPEKGGWSEVSRTEKPDLIPVEYTPAMEPFIKKDVDGREWFYAVDRHGNPVMKERR